MGKHPTTFIDLFAGIGGFHLALSALGAECVFVSDIDPHARATYAKNFPVENVPFNHDLWLQDIAAVPNHDILCAGFPCQPFSQAGHQLGFTDAKERNRGNLFFRLAEVLEKKRPPAFILENVKHLVSHDGGRTLARILSTLDALGYTVKYRVLKASDYGVPQLRPRVFFVGLAKSLKNHDKYTFPEPEPLAFNMSDVFKGKCDRDIGYTLRVGGRGSRLGDRHNWEYYLVDGVVRRLGVQEGKKMMGLPEGFRFPVSETQAMKQLGNSVCVPVVRAVAEPLLRLLQEDNV